MSQRDGILILVSFGALCAGVTLEVLSVDTNLWPENDNGLITVSLFEICNFLVCKEIPNTAEKFNLSVTFAVVGVLFGASAAMCALIYLLQGLTGHDQIKAIAILALLLGLFSPVSTIVADVLFLNVVSDLLDAGLHVGYSFILSVHAAVWVACGSVGMFFAARKT